MASYSVSYQTDTSWQSPYTGADNVIKPYEKDIIKCMFDEKAAKCEHNSFIK